MHAWVPLNSFALAHGLALLSALKRTLGTKIMARFCMKSAAQSCADLIYLHVHFQADVSPTGRFPI
jgi:hypothetical protein